MRKMNEIRSEVVASLQYILQDENMILEEVDVVKINDLFQYGIVFRKGAVGKTLYINDFMSPEKSAAAIAEEMLLTYENSVDVPPYDVIHQIHCESTLAALTDHLYVALLEMSRNENYLQNLPYHEVGGGLAYICQIRHKDTSRNEFMSAAVTQDLASSNGWDLDELFELAINNTLCNDAPVLYPMKDALTGKPENLLNEKTPDQAPMLILSNKSQVFGAASLFLPGVIDKIHAYLDSNFFAIPSSIHEFIIVPETDQMNLAALSALCKEANQTVVDQKDILSDHVLFFPLKRN